MGSDQDYGPEVRRYVEESRKLAARRKALLEQVKKFKFDTIAVHGSRDLRWRSHEAGLGSRQQERQVALEASQGVQADTPCGVEEGCGGKLSIDDNKGGEARP